MRILSVLRPPQSGASRGFPGVSVRCQTSGRGRRPAGCTSRACASWGCGRNRRRSDDLALFQLSTGRFCGLWRTVVDAKVLVRGKIPSAAVRSRSHRPRDSRGIFAGWRLPRRLLGCTLLVAESEPTPAYGRRSSSWRISRQSWMHRSQMNSPGPATNRGSAGGSAGSGRIGRPT